MFSPHLFEHVKAATSGQIYIEDDQVPAFTTYEIKRFLGVACFSECSALEFVVKYSFEAVVNHRVIVNY
jgi:hypothetical protein